MPIVLSRKGGGGTGGTGGTPMSIGVSTGGNTAGNTTVNTGSRFVIVGSNGITASQATAPGATTVTLSGITQSVQTQGQLSMGVSTGGNTAGNTTVNTGSRFVLVASGNATASQATAAGATTVTLSVGTQSVQTEGIVSMGVSTGGNTSGNTTVNTGSRLVLAGGNNITLSQATAAGATTVSISAPNLAAGAGTLSMWPVFPEGTGTTSPTAALQSFTSAATRTTIGALVWPFGIPLLLTMNTIKNLVSNNFTSATSNSHWGYTLGQSLGIYSLNVSTLSRISSFSNDFRFTYSSAANSTNASASFAFSYGSGAGLSSSSSLSTNNAGVTGLWSSITGFKNYPFAHGDMSLSAGQYFGVYGWSSSTSGANLGSLNGLGIGTAAAANVVANLGQNVAASIQGQFPLNGVVTLTQTDTGFPGSFATADITLSTNSAAAVFRQPYFHMFYQLT